MSKATVAIGGIFVMLGIILGHAVSAISGGKIEEKKVSEFGKYQGYTESFYDGSTRISDYLTLPNGTRLAYDLILPTKKGALPETPLPCLFKYTPYLRTFTIFDKDGKNIIADLARLGWKERVMLRIRYWLSQDGRYMDPLFRTPWLKNLVKHGYAVIVVERPGTGASFGTWDPSHEPGARQASEIIDWIASRPWSNGKVGMFGDSFQAMIQMATAAMGNPHLKAIFPTSAPLEMYESITFPGGIYNKAFGAFFKWSTSFLHAGTVTPVDRDSDGKLLAKAREERAMALPETIDITKAATFRDSVGSSGISIWQDRAALYPFTGGINRSGVAVYMTNGWYDLFTADMFYWFDSLTAPKRLIVRPVDHSAVEKTGPDLDYGAEAHRWFDYWLKGIDNGIMNEPPIHYYVMGKDGGWKTASRWPPTTEEPSVFYFNQGRTGSVDSINDGLLSTESPGASALSSCYEHVDEYTVDYTTTTGKGSRWSAVNWARRYPDMSGNDRKALTYSTMPLKSDVEITGHPMVRLWLATDVSDLDVFIYLEEVGPDGRSTYITEGMLRASHRKLGKPPFKNLGLPYHTHFKADVLPIRPGAPFELLVNLLPTAYRFREGNRIRIAVAFSDADNFDTPVIAPAPRLRLLRGKNHLSFLNLPIAQPRKGDGSLY